MSSLDITRIWIGTLDYFKMLSGMSDDEFYKYFNENNWDFLKDDSVICGMCNLTAEEIVDIMGRYLSEDERRGIMDRYYRKRKEMVERAVLSGRIPANCGLD